MHSELPLAAMRAQFSDLVLKPQLKKKVSNFGCFASGLILFLLEDADVGVLVPLSWLLKDNLFFEIRLVGLTRELHSLHTLL